MNISELRGKFDEIMQAPGNWKLHDLHIIAPYPTDSFFRELINYLKPANKLHLYVDDGWPDFKVEEIKKVLNNSNVNHNGIKRISGKNAGLVHAKIYFFKWKSGNGEYIRHVLIGSANASLSGFGRNAETYALIRRGDIDPLEGQKQFPLEQNYFTALANKGYCDECYFEFGQSSWISLPAIKTVSEAPSSFDAWLQRGYLCHKFDPTANFGKFVVKTINPITPSNGLAAFTQAQLQSVTASTQITDAYIQQSKGPLGRVSWKSRLFVETIYGHWTSEDCYRNLHTSFLAGGANDRQQEIHNIRNMANCQTEINRFLTKLQNAANIIGTPASRYLYIRKGGSINTRYYTNIATVKFNKDRRMAMDNTFATRYIHGYAFPSFPKVDETSFEEFALSFCDEILLEINKGNTKSKLAKAFQTANLGGFVDADDLLAELRENWQKYYKIITNYWI